jgi:glycosyltransferase involved in cell wall biosynthesis
MRILQLCPKPLFNPLDGGKIAMRASAEGIQNEGHEVVQWMISTPRHPWPASIPSQYPFQVFNHFTDTRVKVWSALLNLFSKESYNLIRFRDASLLRKQIEWLTENEIDLIQAESIFTLTNIRELRAKTKVPIYLRAHNVEYLIWKRMAEQCRNPLKRAYLNLLSKRLKTEEIAICNACNGMSVMSEIDAALFREAGVRVPITVVGISTNLTPTQQSNSIEKKQLFHLGAMDWLPNREGVDWFIRQVWPDIHAALPEWKLVLAGKAIPSSYSNLQHDNIFVKPAPDAADFMQEEGIMIVPLLSGSGIRVKIIEGMALGKVIITTSIGLEGIPAQSGVNILIANEPADFLRIIKEIIAFPQLAQTISENALTFANEHFRSESLSQKLLHFYKSNSKQV